MANEFKVKNGLIVIGDLTTSGTITINGALAATQSWVTSQAYLTSSSLTSYATQSYVTSAIASLVDSAPGALDTLRELATALGNDASFSTTITNSIAAKLPLAGGTLTGALLMGNGVAAAANSQPTALSYGLLQAYGTFTLAADTDGSQSEFAIITAGYGVASASAANGLAIGFNTLTWKNNTVWHAGNLTNLNQLSNGPGYLTSYTETDTLASVTARGNTTTNSITVGNLTVASGASINSSWVASGVTAYWRFIFASAANNEGYGVGPGGFGIYREGMGDYHLKFKTDGVVNAPYGLQIASQDVATRAWVNSQGFLTSVSDIWVNTAGDTMTGTLSFQQPVGLSFANGQYIKDNNSGGLIIYSGAAVNINGTSIAISNNTTVGGWLGVTGIVSAGARKLSMGILDLNSGVTPTQYKIKTNIPWNYGGSDFTVNIKGFRYGVGQMVSLSIGWHFYADQFYNRNAISNGAWAPTISLAKSPDGYVIIYIPGPDYWPKLYVESVYSSNSADSYTSGWSWTDADLSDCTLIQTVPYKDLATSITGNSGTTSQTNFSSLTINSAAVATQAYVGSQGYLTSYTETDTLQSVTSRGSSTSTDISIGGTGGDRGLVINHGSGALDYGRIRFYQSGNNISTIHSFSTAWQGGDVFVSGGAINISGSTGVTFGSWNVPDVVFRLGGSSYFRNNVGIGTTAPGSKLSVLGNNDVLNVTSQTADTSLPTKMLAQYVGLFNNGSNGHHLYINSSQELGSPEFNITKTWGGYLTFGVSGDGTARTRALYINNNGYVGVNVNPISGDRFEVAGSVRIHTGNNWDAIQIYSDGANGYIQGLGDETGLRIRSEYGNILLADNRGNVGIGTTSPAQKLSVAGNIETVSGTGVKIGFNVADSFTAYGNSAAHYGISYNYGSSPVILSGYFGVGLFTNGTERFSINNAGNVGIGTTSPSKLLEVAGDIMAGTSNKIGFRYSGGDSNFYNYITANNANPLTLVGGMWTATGATEGIRFSTYNGAAVSILNNGNVGIGTTTPTAPLEITNTGGSGGGLTMFTSSYYSNLKYWGMRIYGIDNGNGIHYSTDVQVGADWYSATKVGHGQNATNPSFQSYYTTYLATNGGNVGIGTSTPQVKLDVNGALGIVGSNFIYFGHTTGNIGAWTTRQYSSGSTHKFNAQTFIFNNEGYGSYEHMALTANGVNLRGKNTIDSTDSWLRLNQSGDYGSGVYTPGVMRADGGFQVSGNTVIHSGTIGSQSVASATTSTSTYRGIIEDTRAAERTPNDYDDYKVSWEFTNQIPGLSGNTSWWSVMTMQGWHNGYSAWQIIGSSSSAIDDFYLRAGNNTTWNTARRIWHSGDFTSTNVSNWNTAFGWGNHASASYATTSYVTTQINNLIAGAPGALDTLDELAAALGDDASFATTVTNSIAAKLPLAGGTMSGNITMGTGTNILFTGGSHAIAGNNTGYLHFYDYTNVYFNNQLVIRGGIQNDGGNVLIDDNLNVNGELAFLSGGGGYTNIIRSAAYPSEGYPPGSNYWIEYRAQGGHHFILNTDGGVGSGANTMDDFVVWQGAIDGNRLLEVSNIGNLWIAGSLTEASSLKLKENVKTSEGNLEKVVNLRPVTYNKIGSQTKELGLIAEEVATVYPEFVQYDESGEPVGVNYSRLTAALIGAVKELTNQVQELNKKING